MINLRYHIVSLTAVFLAIGIGLTLGSTFLDRATVDNLNGQLENLETRLGDREDRVGELEELLDQRQELQTALDEQATGLLADQLDAVPVVIVASRGVDEEDINASVQALVVAGADVQGLWWFTDRWLLDDASELEDLGGLLGEESTDPSRLRRTAINTLGAELRGRQLADPDEETTEDPVVGPTVDGTGAGADPDTSDTTDTVAGSQEPDEGTEPEADAVEILVGLSDNGFIEFEAVPGGPEQPTFPAGTRLLIAGGSSRVPDDLVVEPLVARLTGGSSTPILAVAASALPDDEGVVSDLVTVIRQDERLRELVPTVAQLEHFEGWAAMVLAMGDVGEGVVGHYGLGEDSSRLLPPPRAP